jgi:hypothetical protein
LKIFRRKKFIDDVASCPVFTREDRKAMKFARACDGLAVVNGEMIGNDGIKYSLGSYSENQWTEELTAKA